MNVWRLPVTGLLKQAPPLDGRKAGPTCEVLQDDREAQPFRAAD
jgi:hypothetical protein